jgi:hypothetical protein
MNRLRLSSAIVVAVGCLMLAACGSSSQSLTATTTAIAAGGSSAKASPSKTGTTASRPVRQRGRLRSRPLTLQPAAKHNGIVEFAACMRKNGVDLPAPNTSGKGPILDTKGVNAASPTFRAAEVKCRNLLLGGFRAHAGGA